MYLPSLFFLLSTVAAIHPFSLSRRPRSSHDINPSRPRLAAPSLVDICASVDLGLLVGIQDVLGLALPNDISTDSSLCLCLQDLDLYLDSDTRLVWLTNLIGQDALSAHLAALINTSPSRQGCTLPTHAHRTCTNQDVCRFDCDTNYVRFGNSCICNPPFSICNGVCGNFNGCASPVPRIGRGESEKVTGSGYSPSHVDVERATCADGECFAKACATGWIYSKDEDACIRSTTMSRRNKRSVVRQLGDGTLTLDIHVTINMVRLLRAIRELYGYSAFLRNQTDPKAYPIVQSCDRIDQVAIDMVGSATLGAFLDNTYRLLNVAQLLDGLLSSCGCLNSLGLAALQADLGAIVASSTNILNWYHAPGSGTSGSSNSGLSTSGTSSSVNVDTPITITLNRWLGDLGLNGVKSIVQVGGLGGGLGTTINGLLDGLGIGHADEGQTLTANTSFDNLLHMRMGALIGYALDVGGSVPESGPASPAGSVSLTGSTPLAGSAPQTGSALTETDGSEDMQTILAPVSRATLGLLLATDLSALLDNLDSIIAAATNARTTLELYGTFDSMTTQLSLVSKTALDVKSLCTKQLGSDASGRKFTTAKAPGDGSVVISLDGLLYSLGVSGNVTIGGLGTGLSAALNSILSALDLGATRAKKSGGGSGAVKSAIFMDSRLAELFRTTVESAIDLDMKTTSSAGSVASLLAGSMPSVISSMQAILGSPTVAGLIGEVDGLLKVTGKMNRSLMVCNCTTLPVQESAGRFVTAVKLVGKWLDEHAKMNRSSRGALL